MSHVELGSEQERCGKLMRCIRITKQTSLFEDVTGKLSVVTEDLLEFKGGDGSIDFEVLASEQKEYEGVQSQIKAAEPIVWKRD